MTTPLTHSTHDSTELRKLAEARAQTAEKSPPVRQIIADVHALSRFLSNEDSPLPGDIRARVSPGSVSTEEAARLLLEVTRERDEARKTSVELHRRLTTRPLAVCAYCAEPMPEPDGFDGTTAARVAWMDAHMRACPEHPMSAVIRERDELRAALLNERGEGEPPSEGWEWIQTQHQHGVWVRDHMGTMVQRTTSGVWYWTSVLHGFSPDKIRDTAREAMRAADTALAGAKS